MPSDLAVYILSDISVLLQWVLSDRLYGFHYPISLTMMHMGFSAVVAFILVRIFKVGLTFHSQVMLIWNLFSHTVLPWGSHSF